METILRIVLVAAVAAAVAGCGRHLSDGEIAFTGAVYHEHLDYDRIRVKELGLLDALQKAVDEGEITAADLEALDVGALANRPEGVAIGYQIFLGPDLYSDDVLGDWPPAIDVDKLYLLVHEMAHVWQYQNRDLTKYSMLKALREHQEFGDAVYEYDRPPYGPLLGYRFEQQAAILGDYAVLLIYDPNGWRPAYEETIRTAIPPTAIGAAVEAWCRTRGPDCGGLKLVP